jgi:hypothetical protein
MKKINLFFAALFLVFAVSAQTVSTFDTLPLAGIDTFWEGTLTSTGFADGNAYFPNTFDTSSYGNYFSGFAYSNMYYADTSNHTDTDLAQRNSLQFGAVTGSGYGDSGIYAVAYGTTNLYLTGSAEGGVVDGFYATNTEYAYISMKYGDDYEPAFTYANKDSFVLKITGWYKGLPVADTVSFYLADFRDSSVSPGIVTTWQWVNLRPLGNVDSLGFSFVSSQKGQYGINTPLFFAMDNFTTSDTVLTGIHEVEANTTGASVFPNPFNSTFKIAYTGKLEQIQLFDLQGRLLKTMQCGSWTNETEANVAGLSAGCYFAHIITDKGIATLKIVKQ